MESRNQRELLRTNAIRTLNHSISTHGLTVVTAPAGYGKTVLARRLTGKKIGRRFFHFVPDEIAGPDHWWDALFLNLVNQGMEQAAALRRIGFPRTPSMTRQAVDLLDAAGEPFLLVLDDLHNFNDAAVGAFLETAVRAQPANHRFILFSRTQPRMDLDGLIREGLAAAFTQSLLRFSEADAVRFFFLNGVSDRNAAKAAWRYSEGWIAALWLCLLNWRAGKKTGCDTPPAEDIESLLDDVVFSGYSPADREFLMMLSVLGSFTAGEAESLTLRADTEKLLRDMMNGNAFIRRDDADGRYVFHSIFRGFLEKKLATRKDVDTPELHRRAAECHIWRRDSMPAFWQLVRAGRDEDLLRILEVVLSDSRQNIFNVKRGEFLPIIENIPWRLRLRQPLGYLLFIWLSFDDEVHVPHSVALFEEMARRFARAKGIPPRLRRRLAGEVEFMRGWIYTASEPELLPSRYENAARLLDGPSITRYERRCWNFGSPHVLFVYLPDGVSYSDCLPIITRACPPLRRLTGGVIEGCDAICQAEYHLERGEFEPATRIVGDLEQILDFPRNMTSLVMARFLKARILCLESATENAALILTDLLRDIEAANSSEHIQCAELALGYILANYGLPDAAPQWLRDQDIFERPFGATRIRGFMTTVCGKLLLAKGDMDGLAALLSERPDVFGPGGFTFGNIHAAVFRAALAWRRGEEDRALASVREAASHARPDGFVLPLGEYGRHILPLLRRLENDAPGDGFLKKAARLAERAAAVQRRNENRAKHALTGKECEIMRLVAKGRSSSDIAAKLRIAESQAKYVLSRAYKKLGAKNRAEAARLFQRGAGKPPPRNPVPAAPTTGCPPAEPSETAKAFFRYLRAGREGDLLRALELFLLPASQKMLAERFEEVCAAVQLFPWPERLARPLAYMAFLWRSFRVFDGGTSTAELDEVSYRLAASRDDDGDGYDNGNGELAGEIELIRSLAHAHDARALWDGHAAALKLLGGASRLYSAETSWTFGNPHSAFGIVRNGGEFTSLLKPLAAASSTLAALSGGLFASLDAAFRMERHLERGETDEAVALLPELKTKDGDMQAVIVASFARARLLLAEGLPDVAVSLLERLVPHVRRFDSFEYSVSLDLALGFVYAHLGRVDDVPPWIRFGKIASPPHGATARRAFASVTYGKCLLAAGDFARLESAARTLPQRLGAYDSLLGRIHAKVQEAIAADYCRRSDEATTHLARAVELARPDGLVFSIAEYGEPIVPLLHRLQRGAYGGDDHLKRIAALAERKRGNAANGKTAVKKRQLLTAREREIMRFVARGKSNAAIAEELNLSGSRIAKALSKIYEKLNVSNRAEAARVFDKM